MAEPTFPEPSRGRAAAGDRRGEERFSGRLVNLLVRPGLRRLSALVANASAGGLGLMVDEPIAVGTVLALVARGWEKGKTGIRSAKVVHCTPHQDGLYLVGCRLDSPLTDAELATLLGEG